MTRGCTSTSSVTSPSTVFRETGCPGPMGRPWGLSGRVSRDHVAGPCHMEGTSSRGMTTVRARRRICTFEIHPGVSHLSALIHLFKKSGVAGRGHALALGPALLLPWAWNPASLARLSSGPIPSSTKASLSSAAGMSPVSWTRQPQACPKSQPRVLLFCIRICC